MVEIAQRAVCPEDIAFVVASLWDNGVEECRKVGIRDKAQLAAQLESLSHEMGWTFLADGEPVAVAGAHSDPHGTHYTWFVATHKMGMIGLQFTLWLRRWLKNQVREKGVSELEVHSAAPHPDAERWFTALGFIKTGSAGVFTYYRYAQKAVD